MEEQAEQSHLIMLVGTNPLPNFVVAKYLKSIDKLLRYIWLLYSAGDQSANSTKVCADRIQNLLKNDDLGAAENCIQYKAVALSSTCAMENIQENLDNLLKQTLLTHASKIHFHYSGGTKPMAIHTYRWLEGLEAFEGKCSFSYLDARTYELIEDGKCAKQNIKQRVFLTLEEMLALHGYKKKVENKKVMNVRAVLEKFDEKIQAGNIKELFVWNQYCRRRFFCNDGKIPKNLNGFLSKVFPDYEVLKGTDDKKNNLKKNNIENKKSILQKEFIEQSKNVLGLLQALPDKHAMITEYGELLLGGNNGEFANHICKPIKEFFDGKWLEYYVEPTIQDIVENHLGDTPQDKSFYWDKGIKIQCETSDSQGDFELDFVLVHGYELFVISCTTAASQSIVKEKFFEVLHRVTQIGGDEAKGVVLSMLEEQAVEELKNILSKITGNTQEKILLLGSEKVLNRKLLREKLIEFIARGERK